MKLRALDLFCGAGGATMGLMRAGFEVVGIDHNPKRGKRYPATFVCADALNPPVALADFDFVWASPPCQAFSVGTFCRTEERHHVNMIPETRDILSRSRTAWVIENVPRAPLRPDIVCTGSMFGLPVIRKRIFEAYGFSPPLKLDPTHGAATTMSGELACVAGHGTPWRQGIRSGDIEPDVLKRILARNSAAGWRAAMGIDWMTRDELAQAIPPAYAEYIGRHAAQAIRSSREGTTRAKEVPMP